MEFLGEVLDGARLPSRLRDLERPPAQVYVCGSLPRTRAVAIVGTRRPTPDAVVFAERLARLLAEAGVAVLSGGAIGIDAAAHRGALAARGATVVVMPAALDRLYPAEHASLFSEIVDRGGALLSPFPPGTEARRHQFFARNGALAALADELVLVEAPLRSGARNACAWARRLGRPCYAVPAAPWNPAGRGCLAELELGARLLTHPGRLIQDFAEQGALTEASAAPSTRRQANATPAAPIPLEASLRTWLAEGPLGVDRLVELSGWSVSAVNQALFHATLQGDVIRLLSGEFAWAGQDLQ
jgi:DNA processing protein